MLKMCQDVKVMLLPEMELRTPIIRELPFVFKIADPDRTNSLEPDPEVT